MKNDEEIKNILQIKELKSANKNINKKQYTKNLSHSKLKSINFLNNFSNKNDNLKIPNSEKKEEFLSLSTNKIVDKEIINNYNILSHHKTISSFKNKPIDLINKNQKTPISNRNSIQFSNKKSKNLSSSTTNNLLFNNNNNNNIKIQNINNIQNYNSFNIIKKTNNYSSLSKLDDFTSNNITNIYNLNTPVSFVEKSEKNLTNTETRSKSSNKLNIFNLTNFENISNSNTVKVVVRFRPMNNMEFVKNKLFFTQIFFRKCLKEILEKNA